MSRYTWKLQPFAELSRRDLYEMIALRLEVFVIEQDCPYQDCDGKDYHGYHLNAFDAETKRIVAHLRILPPGISYAEASIGRVVNRPELRGTGLGFALMQRGVEACERLYGTGGIRISAQCYLEKFYNAFGFEALGEEYLEDNLPHIEMLRPASISVEKPM